MSNFLPGVHDLPQQAEIGPLRLDRFRHTACCGLAAGKRITPARFRHFLLSAAAAKASDVTLQTDAQPRIEIEGNLFKLEGRPWSGTEIEELMEESYGAASGSAEIRGQKALDYSYEIPAGPGRRQRFRVNATGIYVQGGFGMELTFRVLPDDPPHVSEVGLTDAEIELMTPGRGLVIVAGATGSGKSTTLAALARHHLEDSGRRVKIVDIQAPIEFTYSRVIGKEAGSSSLIGQSEIGRHLPDFAAGVRSALRRKPHIIMVGESRDRETIAASLEAALTGHLVYTTAHAGSVHDCVRRLLASFPASEREHRAGDLGACLQFVTVQRLLPRSSGTGRTAMREWMSFSQGAGSAMLSLPSRKWPRFILNCMAGKGSGRRFQGDTRTFEQSASVLAADGLISAETQSAAIRQVRSRIVD